MSRQTIVARPYAKAVFEIALQQKSIKAWSELLPLAAWVVRQPAVQALLDNPQITAQQCCEFLLNVCAAKLTTEGRNFLKLLAAHDRFSVIPEIAEIFEEYRVEQEKLAKVQVASALPLSQQEQTHLTEVLTKRLQREVILECQVDAGLIGGLMIHANDLVIDGSIRGKLGRLQTALLG